MAVRRYILAAVFIVLLAISYTYLGNKYNTKTIEFSFAGDISMTDIDFLQQSVKSLINKSGSDKELPCILNFISRYGDGKLIMTSGMDSLIKGTNLQSGRWIANSDINEAVLGDKVSDRRFRSIDVIGQTLRLYGQEYKIVGIIKNSDDIYISFDDNNRIAWDKKNIKFIIEDEKRLQLYVEILEGKLSGLGLDVIDVNNYKQEVYWYINIILTIAIYALFKLSQILWRESSESARFFYSIYKERMRVIEWYKYINENRKDISILALKLSAIIILALVMIKCITLLNIPSGLIPGNLFSPTSYMEMVKVNLQSYLNRLENGISGILLDIHIINLLLIIYIGIAVILNKKASV